MKWILIFFFFLLITFPIYPQIEYMPIPKPEYKIMTVSLVSLVNKNSKQKSKKIVPIEILRISFIRLTQDILPKCWNAYVLEFKNESSDTLYNIKFRIKFYAPDGTLLYQKVHKAIFNLEVNEELKEEFKSIGESYSSGTINFSPDTVNHTVFYYFDNAPHCFDYITSELDIDIEFLSYDKH